MFRQLQVKIVIGVWLKRDKIPSLIWPTKQNQIRQIMYGAKFVIYTINQLRKHTIYNKGTGL